jgi:hypothetical protein
MLLASVNCRMLSAVTRLATPVNTLGKTNQVRNWNPPLTLRRVETGGSVGQGHVCESSPPYRMWPYLDGALSGRTHNSHLRHHLHARYRWTRVWLTWKHGVCVFIVIRKATETVTVTWPSPRMWRWLLQEVPTLQINLLLPWSGYIFALVVVSPILYYLVFARHIHVPWRWKQ